MSANARNFSVSMFILLVFFASTSSPTSSPTDRPTASSTQCHYGTSLGTLPDLKLLHQQDVLCAFQYLTDQIDRVHAMCGNSTKTCSLDCGLVFIPLFKRCHTTLSILYDVSGKDKKRDSKSEVLEHTLRPALPPTRQSSALRGVLWVRGFVGDLPPAAIGT